MKHLPAFAVALAAIGVAAPGSAQNGAAWVDPLGRMMTMNFLGGGGAAPAPQDRTPAAMAQLFKDLCLDTGGELVRISTAATAAGLISREAAGGAPPAPASLNVWNGNGLAVSQTSGYALVPNAQCNTTFYVSTLPSGSDVAGALAAAIGADPSNLAEAKDKKGKPRKYFQPEWTVDSSAGQQIVSAMVIKHSRYHPGDRVHISIRTAKKPAGKR